MKRKALVRVASARKHEASEDSPGPVPVLNAEDATFEAFAELYELHQAVLVRRCLQFLQDPAAPPAKRRRTGSAASSSAGGASASGRATASRRQRKAAERRPLGLLELRRLFAKHPKVVRRAFNLEQAPKSGALSKALAEEGADEVGELLGGRRSPAGPWYASFVVQRSRDALSEIFQALPMAVPPFLDGRSIDAKHSNAVWVFFGTNPRARPMQGRPEHTDAIAHSGTWHLQLRGSKVWSLRPTTELRRSARPLRKTGRVLVRCREGDVLCVNTRLWWHSTYIPGRCPLSLSVARDMWLGLGGAKPERADMTNVDGHYATRSIPEGTVIFSEEDAPDLELPRSKRPNCAMAEGPEGELLVVASRQIASGEWFSLAESEDEG